MYKNVIGVSITTNVTFKDCSKVHSKTVMKLSLKPTTLKVLTNDEGGYVKDYLKKCTFLRRFLQMQ